MRKPSISERLENELNRCNIIYLSYDEQKIEFWIDERKMEERQIFMELDDVEDLSMECNKRNIKLLLYWTFTYKKLMSIRELRQMTEKYGDINKLI